MIKYTSFSKSFGLTFLLLVSSHFLTSACGVNLFSYLAKPENKKAKLEEAKVLLDAKEYDKASELLIELKDDEDMDGNDVRLMLAAAKLGEAELDLWSIIGNILDSDSLSGGGGNILDAFSSTLFGDGEEKEAKLSALDEAIEFLETAPDKTEAKVANTKCFFSGIMAVSIIADAATQMSNLQDSITAASQGNCAGASSLSSSLTAVTTTALRFTTIYNGIQDCPFIDLDTSSIDGISASLNNITTVADKGCDSIPGVVDAFFPQCVKDAVGIPNVAAFAEDGKIASCELALHCFDPTDCF